MKANVLQARAIQWMQTSKTAFLPDIIKSVRERYSFVVASDNIAEIVSKDLPLGFKHGKLERADRLIVIEGLAIHRKAVIVDVGSSTSDCDEVLDDLLSWATDALELTRGPRLYASQLEVRLNIDLRRTFPQWAVVADRIAQFNRTINSQFEFHRPDIHFAAIALNPDPAGSALACGFRLERREGQPYAENLYYAEAPMSTAEHIRLLAELQDSLQAEGIPPA